MTAEIISIGDELLIGQVVNTNASWMARQLHSLGIAINQITAIADTSEAIRMALDIAMSRSDITLMTGGLGPTRDDITKHVLCEYFGSTLTLHEPTLEKVRHFFAIRGLQMTEANRKQAEIPSACTPILNHKGTAPGMWFERDGKTLVSMPGVPFEMESMMQDFILPRLAGKEKQTVAYHQTIQTQGVGESFLMEMIKDWEDSLPGNFKLAYLPQAGLVRLRLTAKASSMETARKQVDEKVAALKKIIPDLIFGYGDETFEEVIAKLLREKKTTIATAESCTGGYLAHLITSVPGSSEYYLGSVIAYANEVKVRQLGVSEEALLRYGAVSEQVVKAMAEGARRIFGTAYALATSGIAGPNGGTKDKPVGLVWIALATPSGTLTKKSLYGEDRGRNIRRASLEALNMLRLHLIKS